ncbi:MAG TPA: hypothetical protein VFO41_18055 [Alphaproteobacteria bacterium]|nr:hypothetical protein [Alphaproteobacteria bacterium]
MTSSLRPDGSGTARGLARALGWFSIALGAGELLGARKIKLRIGAPGSPNIFRIYGVREIATGALILASPEPNRMVWARVAGDALDLVTLLPTLRSGNPVRGNAVGALAFVAGATLLDIACAAMAGGRRQPGY